MINALIVTQDLTGLPIFFLPEKGIRFVLEFCITFVIAQLGGNGLNSGSCSGFFQGRIYVLPYIIFFGQAAQVGEPETPVSVR